LLSVRGLNRVLLALPSSTFSSRVAVRRALGANLEARLPDELFALHSRARRRGAFARTIATWMPETHRWRTGHEGVVLADRELGALRQPVHFFWGESDPFGGPEIARLVAAKIRTASVETYPAAHHPQLSCPTACARSLSAFLAT
jgi:pimeloyl-ACP methyl ester carboxylesterase